MDWALFVKFSHIIGTALGVGGATIAEVLYLKAAKDGEIDPHENDTLRSVFYVLRIGMVILVLSGFGYLILLRLADHAAPLYSARVWAKLTIILVLLFGVLVWHTKRIPMWLGSAVSLTSWYAALVIGAWRGLPGSYVTIMLYYAAAIIVMGLILSFIRAALGIKR